MSFAWTSATLAAVTLYSSNQNIKAQDRALEQSKKNAAAQQQAADEANGKANAKTPDVSAMLSAAALASRSGQAGTMLTGPQGLDLSAMQLGKTTLLGG